MEYTLKDLLDVAKLQELLDSLNEVHCLPSAVIDTEGTILTATAWQDICTKFHRVNPETEKKCIESDRHIGTRLAERIPHIIYRCPMGLVDTATPIIIEGKHLGNVFTGQLFIDPPDEMFFKEQARHYGFDESEYLDAMRKVPIFTVEQLHKNLTFIAKLAQMLAEQGLQEIRKNAALVALQKSEEFSRRIIESSNDCIKVLDIEGHLLSLSAGGQKLLEIDDIEPYLGLSWTDFWKIGKEDAQKTVAKAASGEVAIFHGYCETVKGTPKWWEVVVSPIMGADNKIENLLAVSRDITERNQSIDKLRSSEDKFSKAFNACPEMITIASMDDGRYIDVNEVLLKATGYERNEVIGHTSTELNFWLNSDDRQDYLDKLSKAGYLRNYETRYRMRNGEVRDFLVSSEIIEIEKKRCSLNFILDITERLQTEKALKQSEYFFKESQRSASIGSYHADFVAGRWDSSEVLDTIFGIDEDYVRSIQGWLDIVHPEDRGFMDRYLIEEVISNRKPFSMEYRIIRQNDGETRWVNGRGSAEFDNDGNMLSLMGTIQDITEHIIAEKQRVTLEAQLFQAQKMESVGRLAGGVAHDFNNMLTVILGHAELGLMNLDSSHPVHGDLKAIRNTAERSADLTRQLLAFARKQTVVPKVIDLNETVGGMLKMLQRLIGEDIDLTWYPADKLCPVKMDSSQLDQIMANLCVNARDAIADVGKITIETKNCTIDENYCISHFEVLPGNYVKLSVSDNGKGIDKGTLSRIFEPFYTTKELGKGTGLGLSSVYGAVKQNKGYIDVYSEPGVGTTFSIYLPCHEDTVGQEIKSGDTESFHTGNETILLVEDEPGILNMASLLLKSQGYSVLAANTPGEALRLARDYDNEIQLLMTDVVMPGMNGRDLAKNLISLHSNIKCLFMSGYTADVIAQHGVLDEGVFFIQKPFAVNTLAAKLREVLDS